MSETSYIRVATSDESIAGFTLINVFERGQSLFKKARKFANLDTLAVGPHYQRRGIGSLLIVDAKNLVSSLGVSSIELDVIDFK